MEKISFGSDVPGFIYGPEDAPGIVVIQEWWGHTDELEQQAIALSKRGGYRVLTPDLYNGKVGHDKEEAGHLMSNLDWAKARDELTDAVKYLAKNGKKVGVVGFCMGGALSLVAAQHAGVSAASAFYGTPQAPICEIEKIKVPVQLQFGKEDNHEGFSDPKTAQSVFDTLEKNVEVELHLYDKVGHAFLNGFTDRSIELMKECGFPRPDDIETVQKQAWDRLLTFFEKHVKN